MSMILSLEQVCCLCFLTLEIGHFPTAHLLFLTCFFPQCYLVVCLLKGQRRCVQPKHTEPLFILADAGLLQGHDPEGMKDRAAIQLTSVTLPSDKKKTRHLCIFTVLVMGTVNYRGQRCRAFRIVLCVDTFIT